jgi:hypothetical protein
VIKIIAGGSSNIPGELLHDFSEFRARDAGNKVRSLLLPETLDLDFYGLPKRYA